MLKKMLDNLHPSINKDGQAVSAIQIAAANGTAFIQDDVLQLTGPSSARYNLRSYTLGSLVTDINKQAGFTATLLQPSNLAAVVLVSGTYSTPTELPMFTSFLWQLLKPVALAMADALAAENRAILEMTQNTADGVWLDEFGELFGVYREAGEPDELYVVRVFNFSIAPRVNNLAIQKALLDLGYNAEVTDSGVYSFDVNVTLPDAPPQGFVYSYDQLGNLVGLLKAAGTIANIILSGTLSDTVSISDSVSATLSSAQWSWDNITYGQFNW